MVSRFKPIMPKGKKSVLKPVKPVEPLSDRHGWVVNPMSKILLADMHNVYWGSHEAGQFIECIARNRVRKEILINANQKAAESDSARNREV